VTGVDVYQRLAAQAQPLARHFVLVTGNAAAIAARGFVLAALAPILHKPFEVAELLSTLSAVVAQ
jgi:hypothetical protein